MKILCPTCHGKGTINDPKCNGRIMSYSGPNGETCPQITCRSCTGEGWVEQGVVHFPPDEQFVAGGQPIKRFVIRNSK